MPAAYTHLYIAETVLSQLRQGVASEPHPALVLQAVDGSGEQLKIPISRALVQLLDEHQASFRAGAVGPDFFPDVAFGITVSHQMNRRSRTLSDFCSMLADEVNFSDGAQVAFAFGWLTHLCGDVFGHHWVNMEAGGDFETWTDTPPEVIRKHLGLEMLWDTKLKAVPKDFTAPVGFIRRAMLTDSTALCSLFYNDDSYPTLRMLILLVRLANWHTAQADKTRSIRDDLGGTDAATRLKSLCPRCQAAGVIEDLIEGPCGPCDALGVIKSLKKEGCPTCQATGVLTKTVTKKCPNCAASGVIDKVTNVPCGSCQATGAVPQIVTKTCATCNGAGALDDIIRGCALCKGGGKINCANCGGSGKVTIKVGPIKKKVPCPVCLGSGGVSCPHNAGSIVLSVVKKTCPTCNGAKLLKKTQSKTCPTCAGAKLLKKVTKAKCPVCVGAKVVQKVTSATCGVCNGTKVIKKTIEITCAACDGAKKVLIKGLKDCPICIPLTTRAVVIKCLDRLAAFHERRSARAIEIVDDYIRAHECFARCIVNKQFGNILKCFDGFFDKIADYLNPPRILLELLAPDLIDLEGDIKQLVEKLLESVEELVPAFIEEIKKEVLEQAVKTASEKLQLPLKDEERNYFNSVFTNPIDEFSPLANGITLYLLGIRGCGPDKAGFVQAAKVLGGADNIDTRCQPFRVRPFVNPSEVGEEFGSDEFEWEKFFRPFIDPPGTEAHCRLAGFRVRQPEMTSVQEIADVLASPSSELRVSAATLLGSLGADAQPAATSLRRTLRDEMPEARAASIQALSKIDDRDEQFADVLVNLLADSAPIVRAAAAIALGQIGKRGTPALSALGELLKDGDENVRVSASDAMKRINS